jgi:DNA-binding MarR family transcriptional regulator
MSTPRVEDRAMTSPNLDDLPEALSGHVGYLLVRLGKHAQRLFSAEIAAFGLRPPHADIVLTLAARGALSQIDIANTLRIERAHLVALLDQLEALGLVRRAPDPTDRRRHSVGLTDEGATTATRLRQVALDVEKALVDGLSDLEAATLRATLRRLARDADEGD